MSRILAIDPGDARLGLALSDPSQTIASPLLTLKHISRKQDVSRILELAEEYEVEQIVVGVPYDEQGLAGPQARKALRLVESLAQSSSVPVQPWDESGSTQAALDGFNSGVEIDARAAAYILQDYLDAQSA